MRVQIVLSSFGFWGEKLVAPMEEFDAARITYQFATPWGHPPAVVDVSMDPTYIDPPLNAPATTGDGRQGAGGCGLGSVVDRARGDRRLHRRLHGCCCSSAEPVRSWT